jgi:4-hydroxybenzoate polyprenyltransferase
MKGMMPMSAKDTLISLYFANRRFLNICRLHRPTDIVLFLLPGLWSALLASGGELHWLPLLLLLGAALLIRCAAWVYNDWMESRLLEPAQESFIARKLVSPLEAQLLFSALLLLALLLIWPLGTPLLYYAIVALALLLGYPILKTRLLLTQPYLGSCYAWLVPMAWATQGVTPDKSAWLLFTAVLLWATAFTTLYALPRRNYEQQVGIRSLAQLFGENSWLFILAMQFSALFTLWLIGRQLELNLFFRIGLATALLLLPYQHWLLFSHPQRGPRRSYRNQIWSGLALLCGIAFHFLCTCQ